MPRAKLASLSSPELLREIQDRLKKLPSLIRLRDQLDAEIRVLQSVAGESATGDGQAAQESPVRRRRKPIRNAKPLIQYVREHLANAPEGKSVADLEKEILSAGYRSSARRIYHQIATILTKGPEFKKLGRGVYALANQEKPPKKAKGRGKKAAGKANGKPAESPAQQG